MSSLHYLRLKQKTAKLKQIKHCKFRKTFHQTWSVTKPNWPTVHRKFNYSVNILLCLTVSWRGLSFYKNCGNRWIWDHCYPSNSRHLYLRRYSAIVVRKHIIAKRFWFSPTCTLKRLRCECHPLRTPCDRLLPELRFYSTVGPSCKTLKIIRYAKYSLYTCACIDLQFVPNRPVFIFSETSSHPRTKWMSKTQKHKAHHRRNMRGAL